MPVKYYFISVFHISFDNQCREWAEGFLSVPNLIILFHPYLTDQHVPDLEGPVCPVPPGRREGLPPPVFQGPFSSLHWSAVGGGDVALRVSPAHVAAVAAVLHDLPVQGQQQVARHLRLPHLQQASASKVMIHEAPTLSRPSSRQPGSRQAPTLDSTTGLTNYTFSPT